MENGTHFLALLKGGAKPDFAAKTFADALVQQSNEADEISWTVAVNFIKNCFEAINFKLQISAQDVQDCLQNFPWPTEDLKRYIFEYDKVSFKLVERFLVKLCQRIESLAEREANESSPLHYFMQLIAIWNRTCKQLRSKNVTTFFNEPVARIDFQLLHGFQTIREKFRANFPVLDTICDRLLESVLLGVLYQETHATMIPSLTTMLHDEFHLFYRQLNKPNNNFYEIVLTANLSLSYQKGVYKSLCQLLETYCLNYDECNTDALQRQRSLEVSNFLISSKMLEIYYHYLTKENNTFVLISLLEFLLLLQSKLAALDCLLDTFMEAVLALVLDGNDKIGDLSAKFYTAVMKRREDADTICAQCLSFYFVKKHSATQLLGYITRLWKYMQLDMNMDILIDRLNGSDTKNEKFRIWTAHILCAFIEYMLGDHAKHRVQIIELLQKIIQSVRPMKCLITQSILLNIFDTLDQIVIPNKETDFKEVFLSLEECVEDKIWSEEDFQNPLLTKWVSLLKKIAKYSDNPSRIEEGCLILAQDCIEYMKEMQTLNEPLNAEQAQEYSCIMQKLCLMMQAGYYQLKADVTVLQILRNNLFETVENRSFRKYADKYKILIDAYAVELFVVSLVQLFNEQEPENFELIKESVEEFAGFLKDWLQNTELINPPIVRIKMYFNCLLGLYIAFASNRKNSILSLDTATYDMMVRTLLYTIFKATGRKQSFDEYAEHTELHPLRSLRYENSMIYYLAELHTTAYIEINDHYIWQICLYYPTAAKFKNALHDLLLKLSQKRFNIYKRVVPILIYNLYQQQPPWSDKLIMKAVKAHKTFIDNLNIEDRGVFNCHVIFEVMELINKALNVPRDSGRLSTGDRLAPLKHLKIFWNNLNLSAEILQEMQQQVSNLRKKSLRVSERRTLSEFMDTFKVAGTGNASTIATPRSRRNPSC